MLLKKNHFHFISHPCARLLSCDQNYQDLSDQHKWNSCCLCRPIQIPVTQLLVICLYGDRVMPKDPRQLPAQDNFVESLHEMKQVASPGEGVLIW